MAATEQSLPALLDKLTASLDSAGQAIPEAILPPADGISLLDVKNELFLSYLQHLVFLILIKLRNRRDGLSSTDADLREQAAAVKRLASVRVYLEKGVRPLEGKLKYQIDKVVRVANDAARTPTQKDKARTKSDAASDDASSGEEDEDDEDGDDEDNVEVDNLAFRPNIAAFAASAAAKQKKLQASAGSSGEKPDGVYRPPRISATAMPTTQSREASSRSSKPMRSSAVDDYISAELDGAPAAEPSIGSTIRRGGRDTQTDRERRDAAERAAYEESNFIRLAPTKKDKGRRGKDAGRGSGWGAEEFSLHSLGGGGADRVERAVAAGGRKRGLADQDGQRGSGYDGSAVRFGGGGGGRGGGGKRRRTGER